MDIKNITEIVENVKNKPNKDLIEGRNLLLDEFNKTKDLIVELTRHLEAVETSYEIINGEIGKRLI